MYSNNEIPTWTVNWEENERKSSNHEISRSFLFSLCGRQSWIIKLVNISNWWENPRQTQIRLSVDWSQWALDIYFLWPCVMLCLSNRPEDSRSLGIHFGWKRFREREWRRHHKQTTRERFVKPIMEGNVKESGVFLSFFSVPHKLKVFQISHGSSLWDMNYSVTWRYLLLLFKP